MNIYFISGLGADRHAFDRLRLEEQHVCHFIDWLEPERNESIELYAQRMAKDIDTTMPFALIGLSFGGIIAIEISTFLSPLRLVIISSIATQSELPLAYRIAGKLALHRSRLVHRLRNNDRLVNYLFGAGSSFLSQYLRERIAAMSDRYLYWSLNAILQWKQKERVKGLVHIHGTKDRLFPIGNTKADIRVEGGSHFMVMTHAGILSKHINKVLSESDYQV